MKQYISKYTGRIWTEEALKKWLKNFHKEFEANIPRYERPKDYLERGIRVLKLEPYDVPKI